MEARLRRKVQKTTFDEARERRVQDGTEYSVGAVSQFLFKHPEDVRLALQKVGEKQRNSKTDTQDCASRAPDEVLEEDLTYALRKGELAPETVEFLRPCIEIHDGELFVVLSDAYTAIKSGTTKQGNSLKEPCQALHAWGFIPRSMLPFEEWMTWEDYHNPKRITQEMEDYAAESKLRLPVYYVQVKREEFSARLQESSLSVAGHGWPFADSNGVYPRTENPINHAFKLFQNKFLAKDSYPDQHDGDWVKKLAPDFKFFDWGYEIGITEQNVGPFPSDRKQRKILGIMAQIRSMANAIKKWFAPVQPAPAPAPVPAPVPAPALPPKDVLLNAMCMAIQKHEGWYEGSRSWRNRNPGNLVYVGQPGARKETDGRFAVFETYAAGLNALKNLILNGAKGKSKVYHPTFNIFDFFNVYAPASDHNDPVRYAEVVAKAMGVNPATFRLRDLV